MMKEHGVPINVRVPREHLDEAKLIAEEWGTSVSWVVRRALEAWLEQKRKKSEDAPSLTTPG